MKIRLPLFALVMLAGVYAHAQTGCVNSPECPTAVLAAVGATAIACLRRLRR